MCRCVRLTGRPRCLCEKRRWRDCAGILSQLLGGPAAAVLLELLPDV